MSFVFLVYYSETQSVLRSKTTVCVECSHLTNKGVGLGFEEEFPVGKKEGESRPSVIVPGGR